jgi:hypothetical protein
MVQEQPFVKLDCYWGRQIAEQGGSVPLPRKGKDMHPEEFMKPDLLSEFVLLTFGTLTLASLVLFVTTTIARF